ncbi:MAG: hypothetical protein GY851_06555 [bacterium]|nr:hypothetical protein [bacterium]
MGQENPMTDGPDVIQQFECAAVGNGESWPTRFDLIWAIPLFPLWFAELVASVLHLSGHVSGDVERIVGSLWTPFAAIMCWSWARHIRRTGRPKWAALLYALAIVSTAALGLYLALLVTK